MQTKILFLLLLTFSILYSFQAIGQSASALGVTDLKSLDVDKLTDEQVKTIIQRIESEGLTIEQVEILAKQRGVPSAQIDKIKVRIRELKQKGLNDNSDVGLANEVSRLRSTEKLEDLSFFETLNPNKKNKNNLNIFSSEIFGLKAQSFTPSINIATPKGYLLGPGDEVIIDIFGDSEITYREEISPEGKIHISGIGPVSLSGITLEEAHKRLKNVLSNIYSELKGKEANTSMQVSIGQIRTIKVNVVGSVVLPGTYTLPSFATTFNAVYYAGGPNETGSMRMIDVYRQGERVGTLDVYKYLYQGQEEFNPSIQDQDVIIVNPHKNRVVFHGAVKTPAIYEFLENETFDELLSISGGFSAEAYTKHITIDRKNTAGKLLRTVKMDDIGATSLHDGDSVFIPKITSRYQNRVRVEGAVFRAGAIELTENLTLSKAIILSDGLREDATLGRGNILRLDKKRQLTNLWFDIDAVVSGQQDIVLQSEDIIRIPSIFDELDYQQVTLEGEVRSPGKYAFVSNMTVEDLVNLAGGFKITADTSIVEVARQKRGKNYLGEVEITTFKIPKRLSGNATSDYYLQPYDLVTVKYNHKILNLKYIKIEGAVKFPGYYALKSKNERLSSLVVRAGGLVEGSYSEGASLVRRTLYYREDYEKSKIERTLEARKEELLDQYKMAGSRAPTSAISDLIDKKLVTYEKELQERVNIPIEKGLEGNLFRAQQIRRLSERDSIVKGIEDRITVGIQLEKALIKPNGANDLILQDGDILSIPTYMTTVTTSGELLYPTMHGFQEKFSFIDYVALSGGFSDRANKSRAYVIYPNGKANRTKNLFLFKKHPKIKPGTTIIIPPKGKRKQISPTALAAIISSLGTMALVVDRLFN